MKIVDAKCKNCGAELTFDSDKTMLFCPYCGTKLLIIDGDEVKAEKVRADAYREVELAREETKRERDRQEHEREKQIIQKGDNVRIELERLKSERLAEKEKRRYERKKQKLEYRQKRGRLFKDETNRFFAIWIGSCFAILIIWGIVSGIKDFIYIGIPESSKYCIGKQYAIVEQQFKDAGFITVRSEAIEDLYDGFLHNGKGKIGSVKQISVNGEFDFKKNAEYSRFSPVVVYYHEYPKQQEEEPTNDD